jgi:hypothetical protein
MDEIIRGAPAGTDPEGILAALREAGHDWEDADTTAVPAGAPAGERFGPRAGSRRAISAARALLPFAGGAAGAILGGRIAGRPGAAAGRGLGARGGLALARLLGETAGAAGGGMAGAAGAAGLEGRVVGGQELAAAAGRQAALQAPASAIGLGAGGALALRSAMRARSTRQAIEEARQMARAGDIGPDIEQALARVSSERAAAAAAVEQHIQAVAKAGAAGRAAPEITVRDLVEHLIGQQRQRFHGVGFTKADRLRLARDVRERLREVAGEQTLGALRGNRLSYSLPEAQAFKRAFQVLKRSQFDAASRGIRPRPGLDLGLASAWKELIEQRAPGVGPLNQALQGALRREQRLKKMLVSQPTAELRDIVQGRREREVAAAVLAGRSSSPLKIYAGVPVRGGLAIPGVAIKPGHVSEALGAIGERLRRPAVRDVIFWGPRGGATLADLWRDEEALENLAGSR